jgi:hypothetical protein
MSTSRNTRTQRADPCLLDGVFVAFHRSTAGIAWRWRTELALLAATTTALWRLALVITLIWAAVVLGVLVLAVVAVPPTRRYTGSRFWCVLTRHRLQRVCYETRLHTRAGRLPLVLWIRPTKVGVRARILCRAGICSEDFADNAAEIAAACFARETRVTANTKWSHLLTIDIIRHDTLAASQTVTSPLPGLSTRRARLQGRIDDPDLAGTRQ